MKNSLVKPNRIISSDLHLDHKSVITFENRPFVDVTDMQTKIIAEINAYGYETECYLLGDFVLNSKPKPLEALLEQLLPKHLFFVLGNHDRRLAHVFERYGDVSQLMEIKHRERHIMLCHYPMAEWLHGGNGGIHFHGHTHGHYQAPGKILDVCWDAHKRVLTLDEAFDLADEKPIYQPCHSKNNGKL
jgi:calcineurin-like phosphoesterase family protein